MENINYSKHERFWLWFLALLGFLIINLAFIYGLLFLPEAMLMAVTNPISAAFILEAFLLMGAFAYLLSKWGVSQLHWGWFIGLSLLGSMAFALPVVLLWPKKINRAE